MSQLICFFWLITASSLALSIKAAISFVSIISFFSNSEILDHERMNRPGQRFYKILAESALRAVRLCQPLKVPPTGYDKWKEIQLNFNPTEMLKG